MGSTGVGCWYLDVIGFLLFQQRSMFASVSACFGYFSRGHQEILINSKALTTETISNGCEKVLIFVFFVVF